MENMGNIRVYIYLYKLYYSLNKTKYVDTYDEVIIHFGLFFLIVITTDNSIMERIIQTNHICILGYSNKRKGG